MTDPVDHRVNALLAEYHALRGEMAWLAGGELHYQSLGIGLAGAFLGFAAAMGAKVSAFGFSVFVLTPLVTSLLGYLCFKQKEEIYLVAACINAQIVPRIRRAVDDPDLSLWERFRASPP